MEHKERLFRDNYLFSREDIIKSFETFMEHEKLNEYPKCPPNVLKNRIRPLKIRNTDLAEHSCNLCRPTFFCSSKRLCDLVVFRTGGYCPRSTNICNDH
jgi:hypothetical protein